MKRLFIILSLAVIAFADTVSADTVDIPVAAGSDDAEQRSNGSVDLISSDLELVVDQSKSQTVGMRFKNVAIPQGAAVTITNAYIQFTVDEATSAATSLTIAGQASDNPATFSTSRFNISARPRTAARVAWSPPPWSTVGQSGANQRTPNIAPIIQQIVNRPGWSSGNSLVIIITGSGKRVAKSYNGSAAAAPQLHVEFTVALSPTTTPISHVIVIVGENRSFDHVFGVYDPGSGQSVANLLSRGIVNADGSPGPNFSSAAQNQAAGTGVYTIDPPLIGPYATLPRPETGPTIVGQPRYSPDTRFPANLPNGPFQITRYVGYGAYTGSPLHRFFQMWQQVHKGPHDLNVWVAQTAGEGPQSLTNTTATSSDTNYGSEGMGFYNMSTGDAPYFKQLAQQYAIGDNYHQPIMGGTGPNHFFLVTGDVAFFNDDGAPAVPWANQIENPNPQPGTDNWYTQDGYGGGSYVKCADPGEPGAAAIRNYLSSLPFASFNDGNCAADTYYLVNNYKPGYNKDGTLAALGPNQFTVPPQTVRTIAESLSTKGVSWKWYAGGRDTGTGYCAVCDPLRYSTAVMTTPLKNNLQDLSQFWVDVTDEQTLPAVTFLKPLFGDTGAPGNSTLGKFENFVASVVASVQANPALWANSAILITQDVAGGYYDSGYIQPIDFFGDGPRIPLIAVSPYAKPGYVDHTYYDHASILKFIEANWGIPPLSDRSRDRLPNPVTDAGNPYVPLNRPAIGDLMNLFDFNN